MAERGAILLIDDDADVRDALGTLLEQDGYRVSAAATPEQAMELAATACFDVVCCDLHLAQGGSGFEAAATLRQRLPNARFLALTGDASDGARVRAAAAGFVALLMKPIDYATLVAAIESR